MQITIIRHTSLNIGPGICYGQSDIAVSERFEKEARFVFSKISNRKYDAVYSSPLTRCMKLAEFCGHPRPTIDRRLLEMNFGEWECKYWDHIEDPQLDRWFKNWLEVAPTGGESFSEMTQRVQEFIDDARARNHKQILIFTHAGVIRSLAASLGYLKLEKAFELNVDYGQVFEMEME